MKRLASQAVYEAIRDDILMSRLPPGSPLIEAEIAKGRRVSRTPVREALSRLEQDGLLVRGDRSLVVRARSPEEILEIYEVRGMLESMAARDAAQRRTELDVARLRQLHLEFATKRDVDARYAAETNLRFHRAIWTASKNGTCADLLIRIHGHLGRYAGTTTLSDPARRREAIDEHEAILDAIVRRDAEAAGLHAGAHMARARDLRLKLFAEPVQHDEPVGGSASGVSGLRVSPAT